MTFKATLFLTLFAATAAAQIAPATEHAASGTASTAQTFTSMDTVRALHHLYEQRRTGGVVLTALGGGYLLYVGAIAPFAIGFGGAGLIPVVATAAIIGGTTTVVSIRKLARFSKSKEAKMITDYERDKKLPAAMRRKLKPKHFQN